MIPYGRQDITQDDIDAVIATLKSDFLTQGLQTPAFESALCEHTGAKYALAVNSATSALHIAVLALGLGEGDWLWTSPISFVASSNCALYCGAQVDFVDIDPNTYNLSVAALEAKLIQAKKEHRLPKVVVPVHLCGQSCDMQSIAKLAQEYGFAVVEDASHAIGAKYQDQPVGSCEYSDIVIFSFHPVKIITTAEGGAALTNNPELAEKMTLLRSHGITRDEKLMQGSSDGAWYYQQIDLGFNYRMTELQAALGISQIKRLDTYIEKRHQLAQRYNDTLKNLPLVLPYQHPETYSSYHLYPVLIADHASIDRRSLFQALRSADIGVNVHYIPIHQQPFYQNLGFRNVSYPIAEYYYERTISLPLYAQLSLGDQMKIIEILIKELSKT